MPATPALPYLLPVLMLLASNVFMTLAWYGHLRFKEVSLPIVILAAWGIAFAEYCLAVPANRWGSAVYTTGFSVLYLKEAITWNYVIGFALIAGGAFFVFRRPL